MVVVVEPHCFGIRLENGGFSVPTFCKKLRNKFIWLGRTYELHNLARRAMSIIGEES
jgi:hypothetical protein